MGGLKKEKTIFQRRDLNTNQKFLLKNKNKNMDIVSLLSKIGISQSFMQDFFLLIVIVILTVALAFLVGRHRLVSLLFSIYISLALLGAVSVEYLQDYIFQLIFFFASLALFTILGKKIIGAYVSKADFMWRIFVLSFLEVVAISSIVFSILPKKIALEYISGSAYGYAVSSQFHLLWLLVPLIFVYIIRKRLN
jgi:hypothetical protein